MRPSLFSLLLLLALAVPMVAQPGVAQQNAPGVKLHGFGADLFASQKILLSNYCRLDFEGARLQADGWSRIKPFTASKNNPEFNRVIVVSRYDIEMPEQSSETLWVKYQATGYYDEADGYVAAFQNERVAFRTHEQNGNLVVTEMLPQAPHVSARAAMEWFRARLSDPATPEPQRSHLKDAMEQVGKHVPQPRVTASAQ
jgi:hypothetical protein